MTDDIETFRHTVTKYEQVLQEVAVIALQSETLEESNRLKISGSIWAILATAENLNKDIEVLRHTIEKI